MSLLDAIIARLKRGTIAASDWLKTFKILEVRDVPTAFCARKFQMQLVQAKDGEKYISFRIFGDEQETRATFSLVEASHLQNALGVIGAA
jgi:hypothetical protein